MNHYRAMFLPVVAGVLNLKPFGQIKIKLNRSELPNSADSVGNFDVNFRTVKSGFAFHSLVTNVARVKRVCQRILGVNPIRVRAQITFVVRAAAHR